MDLQRQISLAALIMFCNYIFSQAYDAICASKDEEKKASWENKVVFFVDRVRAERLQPRRSSLFNHVTMLNSLLAPCGDRH